MRMFTPVLFLTLPHGDITDAEEGASASPGIIVTDSQTSLRNVSNGECSPTAARLLATIPETLAHSGLEGN